MRRYHKETDRLIAVFFRNISYGEEIAERLRHLNIVNVDISVVHPIICERHAVAALALSDLILMVREDEILTAAMNVDRIAEETSYHRRTFDMPARSAMSPRGLPVRLARLCALPESEVHRLFFDLADHNSCAGFKILKRLMRKLAVLVEFGGAEINIAVNGIGVALVDKGGNYVDYLVNILRCLGVNGCLAHIHSLDIFPVFLNVFFADLLIGQFFLVGTFNYLVVNIREVLNKSDVISDIFKKTAQNIEHAERSCVADMNKIIHRRTAGIDLNLALLHGFKFFLCSCKSVENLHCISSSFFLSLSISLCNLQSSCETGSGMWIWSRSCTLSPFLRTTLAGTPTAVEFLGILSSTTAPAAMLVLSPTVTGPSIFAPAPISTLLPIVG